MIRWLGAPAPGSPRSTALAALVSFLVLGALAARHPELRFVDHITFSSRARALLDGERLIDGLYPVGYPAILAAVRLLVGDVLLAGKLLSVLAGVATVSTVTRWLGPGAGAFVLAQAGLLSWGSTEGTDLCAAAFAIGAVASAVAGHSVLAGTLAAACCLTRYTGVAVVPIVIALASQRGRALAAILVGTAPHWALALALGAPVLPQQDLNLAIGAGHATELASLDTLRRWPTGFARALQATLVDIPTVLGAVGLGIGMIRRHRGAFALAGLVLSQAALIGLAFANPRLLLPGTLACAIGAVWVARPVVLAAAAVLLAVPAWRQADAGDPSAELTARAVTATANLPGPIVSTSPWFHQHVDGWLIAAPQLTGLVPSAGSLTPGALAAVLQAHEAHTVALDLMRTRRSFPGLAPLLSGPAPAGWEQAATASGWRIWRIVPADPTP